MKKRLLPFILSALAVVMTVGAVNAQYYYLAERGTGPEFQYATQGTTILNSGDDVMSPWVNMPFNWDFYGTTVNGYHASDNGYITFTFGPPLSNPTNVALPSASAPTNAIFAYWDDLNIVSGGGGAADLIQNFTYGTSPNRVHVIEWFSVTEKTSGNFVYAIIRLYEGGGFDIVHNYAGPMPASATVGCQNATGTMATTVTGSPAYQYPTTQNPPVQSEDYVYTFIEGTQPAIDLSVDAVEFNDAINGNGCLEATVKSWGSTTVTSFDFNWQIDGGMTYTRPYTNANLTGGATMAVSNGAPVNMTNYGSNPSIKVWVSNVNDGATDEEPTNDEITATPVVKEGVLTSNKRVLIEEFTTAPCQFCPDGELVMTQILGSQSDVYGASIHAGFGTDAMTIPWHSTLAARTAGGAPTANIDRVKYDGEDDVAISRTIWESSAVGRLSQGAPLCVSLSNTYNAGTREISATVDVDLLDYLGAGDWRVSVYVIEDNVVGSGTGYDQVNFYDNQSGHPYFGAGNPIVGYVHPDVVRADIAGNDWGDNTVIPAAPDKTTYSKTYTYTLPGNIDENEVHLVAFAFQYDAADDSKLEIFNTAKADLNASGTHSCSADLSSPDCPTTFTPSTDISTPVLDESSLELFPNPVADDKVYVRVSFNEATDVTMDVYNNMGQKVVTSGQMTATAGVNTFFVDAEQLANGNYFVTVRTDSEQVATQKFTVAK